MSNLLQRINEVRKAIGYVQKDKAVSTGGGSYKAVTHDQVTAVLRKHMAEHGIVSWPNLVESESRPREEGAKQFRYEATYDFTFANVDDPNDSIVIRIQAHAMDNADKAPGKALSYASKYAMLKLFNLETGEDEESRYNPDGMDDDELTAHFKAIAEAPDEAGLKRAFSAAYKAADGARDKDAMKQVVRAKDARKAELGANNG